MDRNDKFKRVGAKARSMQVMRVQGRVREVPVAQQQSQWLNALFAYAELHNNPSLAVHTELERLRTVPASRWRSHRLLLDAHAALLCRFAKPCLRAVKERVSAMLDRDASYQCVEDGLGEFQTLDSDLLVDRCPLFAGEERANTYWEGWVTDSEAREAPARTVSVQLAALRDCTPAEPWVGTRYLVMVAAHAITDQLEQDAWSISFGEQRQGPVELCYSFWICALGAASPQGLLALTPTTLVDAVPLASGRAAWSVGVGVVEARDRVGEEAEQALGAAVELIATLSRGQREVSEQPWQLPIMSAAQLARDSVTAILDTFSAFGTGICVGDWLMPSQTCIYDSKYLYAVSPPGAPHSLRLRAGRYEATLDVGIGQEPVSVSAERTGADGAGRGEAPAQRWSMLYFRGVKGEGKTGA